MLESLGDPQVWIGLLTLTSLEIVLGIDNVIFISILASKLPEKDRPRARRLGLGLAMFIRIGLLFSIAWIARLTTPLFSVLGHSVSGRDLILIVGGLFLLAKATREIHLKLEGDEAHDPAMKAAAPTFGGVIAQILLLDIVFSIDSVITAVGMVDQVWVMIVAVVVAVMFMMAFAGPIGGFVERHPTLKMLALSFLLLIGMTLIAEGLHQHIPKGYVYFAMAFSTFVEFLNIRMRRRAATPVKLREATVGASGLKD
jgi:predicted tellurium resistance membrane protein TerC